MAPPISDDVLFANTVLFATIIPLLLLISNAPPPPVDPNDLFSVNEQPSKINIP